MNVIKKLGKYILLFSGISAVAGVIWIFGQSSKTGSNAAEPQVSTTPHSYIIISTHSGEEKVEIEIADTPLERQKGLQNRGSLRERSGMLFVFDTPTKASFWMKNCLIPLDMIFISEENRIVRIEQNVPICQEETCPSYSSGSAVKYVLEVNAGWTEDQGIKLNDTVEIFLDNEQ